MVLGLTPLLVSADEPVALSVPTISSAGGWEYADIRRMPAPEARQGVASDDEFLYIISNHALGKYRKDTGVRVASWACPPANRSRISMRTSCTKGGFGVRIPIISVCRTSAPSRSGIRRRCGILAATVLAARTVPSPGLIGATVGGSPALHTTRVSYGSRRHRVVCAGDAGSRSDPQVGGDHSLLVDSVLWCPRACVGA